MVRLKVREPVAIQGLFVVFGLVVAAFFPFVSLYLRGRGLSPDEIGLTIAVMASARLLANPIWGHVADTTIGRVVALRIGTIIVAVAALSMNLVEFEHAPARPGDIGHSVLDPAKAERALGWQAHQPIEAGLAMTWRWFAAQLKQA